MMQSETEKPLVCILTLTYNHEAYIRDTLDGFLAQKTNFPFVAIVHDDASTDGTAAIVRDYAKRAPHIIKPIYETENQYSKRDGSLGRIMSDALEKTGAKYVALCEGDDYWTDPLKLQKQVDFLESHPEYSMCYSGFQTVDKDGNIIFDANYEDLQKKSKSGDIFAKLLHGNFILTCTTCVRSEVYQLPEYLNSPASLDYNLFLAASKSGKIKFFKDKLSSYRIIESGQMRSNSYNVLKSCDALQRYYGNIWLTNPSPKTSTTNKLKICKSMAEHLCIQFKHYKNDRHTIKEIQSIIKRHPKLWAFLIFGIYKVLLEFASNRIKKNVKRD